MSAFENKFNITNSVSILKSFHTTSISVQNARGTVQQTTQPFYYSVNGNTVVLCTKIGVTYTTGGTGENFFIDGLPTEIRPTNHNPSANIFNTGTLKVLDFRFEPDTFPNAIGRPADLLPMLLDLKTFLNVSEYADFKNLKYGTDSLSNLSSIQPGFSTMDIDTSGRLTYSVTTPTNQKHHSIFVLTYSKTI